MFYVLGALLALIYLVVGHQAQGVTEPVVHEESRASDMESGGGQVPALLPEMTSEDRVQLEDPSAASATDVATLDGEAPTRKTEIRIALTDWETGETIPSGTVSAVQHRNVIATEDVGVNGAASFSLAPGKYSFVVDGKSLPRGYLPPSRQDVVAPYAELRRDYAPLVVIDGEEGVLDIQVFAFRTARILGRVSSTQIADLSEVEVTLKSVGSGDPVIRSTIHVDRDGFFEAEVIPAMYRVQPRFDQSEHQIVRPAPTDVAVPRGGEQFVEFRIDPGASEVAGVLLDPPQVPGEDEILWDSVAVKLYPSRAENDTDENAPRRYTTHSALAITTTDANGRYRFSGLNPGRYSLFFTADGFSPKEANSRFGAWIEPIEITVDRPGLTDAGTQVAYRARPSTFNGTLTSDSVRHDQIVCEVVYPSNSQSSRPPYVRAIKIDRKGHFEFFVHTSPELTPALLRLRRASSEEWEQKLELRAIPYGHEDITIDFL